MTNYNFKKEESVTTLQQKIQAGRQRRKQLLEAIWKRRAVAYKKLRQKQQRGT